MNAMIDHGYTRGHLSRALRWIEENVSTSRSYAFGTSTSFGDGTALVARALSETAQPSTKWSCVCGREEITEPMYHDGPPTGWWCVRYKSKVQGDEREVRGCCREHAECEAERYGTILRSERVP